MSRFAAWVVVLGAVLCCATQTPAALVIEADKAAIRTEGGPVPGGGWNLWTNGRVGQPVRIAAAGTYQIVVRAWGSPAGGVWPEIKLAAAAEKREQEIVAATQAAIEKHRKADAKLRIVDAAGRPLAGVKVSIEQVSHDFLFGCNIYMFDRCKTEALNAAYKQRFAELFNYATVGFYWRWYEPQRGKPNYPYTDKVVAWCQGRGIQMKGHPRLWGDQAGVPPWSRGQPSAEVQRQRVEEIIGRFRGKIGFWEVVNEPSHLAVIIPGTQTDYGCVGNLR